MYIFRTQAENIPGVITFRKHALDRLPALQLGERVLISQTRTAGDGAPPIRYVMIYSHSLRDHFGQTASIWGVQRRFILNFSSCKELATPFDIRAIQITAAEYGPGGPIVRVRPSDEYEIDRLRLLAGARDINLS